MSSMINIKDMPTNLIAFIYQYLSINDMSKASATCKKMRQALKQDYIYIELSKRHQLFLPYEGDKFKTWKDYFFYLKQLGQNISLGKPNIGYKMVPYRGHKFPIEALAIFNYRNEMNSLIVSGDSNGEVLTWNVDEEGDKEKDAIFKGDSGIVNIKNLNDDCNMLVWTKKNTFYYYEVNMFKKTDKNSERFKLIKQISLQDNEYPIKQIFYEKGSQIIYMSPDINISDIYKKTNIYALNLNIFSIDKFTYSYNSQQNNAVLNTNAVEPNMSTFNYNMNAKESAKKYINYFVVNDDKIFLYINREPVKNKFISTYQIKDILPNVFIFKKNTRLFESYHIDLDYIFNILLINNKEVAFIGYNFNKKLIMKIYNTSYFSQSREIQLYNDNPRLVTFDLLYCKNQEMVYLINQNIIKKVDNVLVKQLKVTNIGTLDKVDNINCIEVDEFRVVLASDELFMGIFDVKTGKKWFVLLGGSKTVIPKSFVKHPNYEGFHYMELTRNSIVSVIGNLIREYKFTFKFEKKND